MVKLSVSLIYRLSYTALPSSNKNTKLSNILTTHDEPFALAWIRSYAVAERIFKTSSNIIVIRSVWVTESYDIRVRSQVSTKQVINPVYVSSCRLWTSVLLNREDNGKVWIEPLCVCHSRITKSIEKHVRKKGTEPRVPSLYRLSQK